MMVAAMITTAIAAITERAVSFGLHVDTIVLAGHRHVHAQVSVRIEFPGKLTACAALESGEHSLRGENLAPVPG
jgi:hypothetical protein